MTYADLRPDPDRPGWWLRATPVPCSVRLAVRNGRRVVTGLHVESDKPITASLLRQIKLGVQDKLVVDSPDADEQTAYWEAVKARLQPMPANTWTFSKRGRGSGQRTRAELETFAHAYADERIKGRHGAVQRVADRTQMHRVTAHRWLVEAVEAGCLPPATFAEGAHHNPVSTTVSAGQPTSVDRP